MKIIKIIAVSSLVLYLMTSESRVNADHADECEDPNFPGLNLLCHETGHGTIQNNVTSVCCKNANDQKAACYHVKSSEFPTSIINAISP